ncbi:MAG: hypothetical protein JO306_04860 [Gemmatimonadetes bacterium]|nr:hypothetical protein [Gemmatimonadota bacterium]
MGREMIGREELHARFTRALADEAPDGVFTFEIDRCVPGPDGCNWYPLASMASWKGNVERNLAAFRHVRAWLAADFNLADAEPAPGDAGASAVDAAA